MSNVDYPTKGHLTSPDTQTNWNGIIGEIALHIYDNISIADVKTYPDITKKSVHIKIKTSNNTDESCTRNVNVNAFLMDINGDTGISAPKATIEVPFDKDINTFEFDYFLGNDAALWSEYTPVVYRLELSIMNTDEKSVTTFGLRKFSTTETRFLINDTPTFLRGKHDGLIFPMTGAFPTAVEEWIRVMKISKSYGINHYRYHTCCPPDAAFVAADLLGIYMEPQLPFWGTLTTPGDEGHNEKEQQYLIEEGYRMLDQADDFFYTSGKLSVQCYKEELEAAARSNLIAGYQILDIQDFSGQGTALVGILDAFMDSKGHVTPQEWAGYCSDAILLAEFPKYVYKAGEKFDAISENLSAFGKNEVLTKTLTVNSCDVIITNNFDEAFALLNEGKKVLFMPNEVTESLEGFYCTDFWCYPMFRDICEWMKKPETVF